MRTYWYSPLAAALLMAASPLFAQEVRTVELRQMDGGPKVVEDVGLDYQLRPEERLSWNYGGAPWLASYASGGKLFTTPDGEQLRNDEGWNKIVLFRFISSAIPKGAKVTSARLRLYAESSRPRTVTQVYELRRVRREGLNFGDANGSEQAGTVSARWSHTGEEGWGNDRQQLIPRTGSDLETSPIAVARLEPDEKELVFEEIVPFVVQDWIDHPERGDVIALYPRTTSHAGGVQVLFSSSESKQFEQRPALEMEVEVPNEK